MPPDARRQGAGDLRLLPRQICRSRTGAAAAQATSIATAALPAATTSTDRAPRRAMVTSGVADRIAHEPSGVHGSEPGADDDHQIVPERMH